MTIKNIQETKFQDLPLEIQDTIHEWALNHEGYWLVLLSPSDEGANYASAYIDSEIPLSMEEIKADFLVATQSVIV